MAEPFKNLISAASVRQAAAHLQRAWPDFDAPTFIRLAIEGLGALEMKARAMQVAAALQATLPASFEQAASVLEAALAPPLDGDDLSGSERSRLGLAGWMLWSAGEFVARHGLAQPERALQVLHAFTQRSTAEFAIRPFIAQYPALTLATLQRWTLDPSAHVRRLVSEGSRPRLPWGLQLKALIADPSPTLPLLLALQDDPSEYVRRSVANHLNDIAKDHPAIIVQWLRTHLPGAPAGRVALLRHASRSLIKQGQVQVLQAWGVGKPFKGQATLKLAPKRVVVGESFRFEVRLQSQSTRAQKLVLDYAVHHVKANGRTTPKVFKGWQLELGAGQTLLLSRRHSMREVTTRRYHPGPHRVELLANGRAVGEAGFLLLSARKRLPEGEH